MSDLFNIMNMLDSNKMYQLDQQHKQQPLAPPVPTNTATDLQGLMQQYNQRMGIQKPTMQDSASPITTALLGTLPAVIGALVDGSSGAAIGAEAGQKGVGMLMNDALRKQQRYEQELDQYNNPQGALRMKAQDDQREYLAEQNERGNKQLELSQERLQLQQDAQEANQRAQQMTLTERQRHNKAMESAASTRKRLGRIGYTDEYGVSYPKGVDITGTTSVYFRNDQDPKDRQAKVQGGTEIARSIKNIKQYIDSSGEIKDPQAYEIAWLDLRNAFKTRANAGKSLTGSELGFIDKYMPDKSVVDSVKDFIKGEDFGSAIDLAMSKVAGRDRDRFIKELEDSVRGNLRTNLGYGKIVRMDRGQEQEIGFDELMDDLGFSDSQDTNAIQQSSDLDSMVKELQIDKNAVTDF